MKTELKDEKYKFWDIIIKAVSSILTISTLILAVTTFLHNQSAELKQKEKEFRKELSNRQLSYYAEISESIGDLLTLMEYPDSLFTKTYYTKRGSFSRLYYGKMNLIESREVDSTLHSFMTNLELFELDKPGVDIYAMRTQAFNVNASFRNSIQFTFDVQLENLTK